MSIAKVLNAKHVVVNYATLPFYGIINTRSALQTNREGKICRKLLLSLIGLKIASKSRKQNWLLFPAGEER